MQNLKAGRWAGLCHCDLPILLGNGFEQVEAAVTGPKTRVEKTFHAHTSVAIALPADGSVNGNKVTSLLYNNCAIKTAALKRIAGDLGSS